MINKKILASILFLLMLGGASPAIGGDFAYSLRFDNTGPSYLVQFDAATDEVLRKIEIPEDSGFNDMVIDEKGGCYITSFRKSWNYGRDIYYYDLSKNNISHFIHLDDCFGPHKIFLTKDELIIQIDGNDRTRLHGGVIFIDRASKKITGRAFIQEDDPTYAQATVNNMYFDGSKNIFLTSYYGLRYKGDLEACMTVEGTSDIYVVGLVEKAVKKIIEVPREYKTVDGICSVGDKIYVAALEKGRRGGPGTPINDELLVFSLEKGTLEKKIKISPHARDMCLDKDLGKLYLLHMDDREKRNTIEIIDVKTDKIIGSLEIPSQLMFSMAATNKMYITVGGAYLQKSRTLPRLLVLDTKTDKIIKQHVGAYQGLSVNPKY